MLNKSRVRDRILQILNSHADKWLSRKDIANHLGDAKDEDEEVVGESSDVDDSSEDRVANELNPHQIKQLEILVDILLVDRKLNSKDGRTLLYKYNKKPLRDVVLAIIRKSAIPLSDFDIAEKVKQNYGRSDGGNQIRKSLRTLTKQGLITQQDDTYSAIAENGST